MATPIVTRVTPSLGHSGGRTLIEISGGNFQMSAEPEDGIVPVPKPPDSVAVYFGTERALLAEAVSPLLIRCLSPIVDPFGVVTVVVRSGSTLLAAAHGLKDRQRLDFGSPTPPAPLAKGTSYYVVFVSANAFSVSATPGGSVIALTSAGTGTQTVNSAGAVDVRVDNLDEFGDPIGGESGTLARAFTPLRPDLSAESHLQTVVGQFVLELRRQVCQEVAWTTHTDYDDTTGDNLNIAYLATLPALVIAGIAFPDKPENVSKQSEDFTTTTDAFLTQRAAVVVDFVGSVIGVSDNPGEALNLLQALKIFFQKNDKLRVPRRAGDPSAGVVEYEMYASLMPTGVRVSPLGDNSNVQSFSADFRVLDLRLEAMPGIPADVVPGVPDTFEGEPGREVGGTAEIIDVGIFPKR